ncbi:MULTISPECIES: flagellar hook-associated protein 2 [Anoxybacillus]|uniref:Flagellar hook-associated protein 2 n=1 Tax=Anoxybacillus flavithermus TaxID=33934 RepID=A0AAX1ZZX4_9BACL|nr:flagellar hook-associated protein 2 [Anoxybacillus flavithermus]ASA96920.1 flagellar cap protein FliD [Anoxybacillus flavithermus]MBE2906179.1 flagellar hook-associated protein 2 [Anoxybacillus flavithermus]MBE2908703.1 flagellar hook-associated protein 2 [Anoxybacillus flavithermus]MBE2911376.1 flagellar hook-associated protein 2 [Anoxybacillus flavithermus]MBE2916965.1 flagellar hook-associated protein 2 [Anoxybacillus flavithermus]
MSTMRIGGLASGMDIDKIVGDLMKVERAPIDKLKQKKQLLEWQRDAYRDMNRLLDALDKHIFDGVMRQSTFLQKKVTSSNENIVTATSTPSASNQTVEISNIEKLATAARWTSGEIKNKNKSDGAVDVNASLASQFDGVPTTLSFQVTKPGSTTPETVSISIDPNTDTLNTLINKLNSNATLGVRAFYDEHTKKMVITKNETGEGSSIKITAGQVFLQDQLKFQVGENILQQDAGTGQNAIFTINGLTTERPSNTFTINGMTYTLKNTHTGTVTISSTTNTDAIFNSIKSFVDKYNETIDEINKKLKETRYRDYQPLTDEQREQLTEKQAEKWEEKARSGILRGDSILSNALSSMRQALYRKVEAASKGFQQLAQIGITTTANYLEGGKLIIDEAKLKQKIEENPEAVYRLFSNNGEGANKGIVLQLRDEIKKTIKSIEDKAGNTLKTVNQYIIGKNILDIDTRISEAEDRLKRVEDRYWKQFSAMEKAVQRANSQSMYLMNAFGGGAQ